MASTGTARRTPAHLIESYDSRDQAYAAMIETYGPELRAVGLQTMYRLSVVRLAGAWAVRIRRVHG